ncbi:MAG: DUF488 domain-containing protein [Bifidobacteriaceae bacterium]|nr:DUF488 domain-containing protein [Bifidobacteriaceae bacterium]
MCNDVETPAAGCADGPIVDIKRAYEEPADDDGARILVDRLWPRGRSKAAACLETWAKDVAPSKELRSWFAHVPERFPEFAERYRAELDANPDGVRELTDAMAGHGRVTLVYAAKDPEHNNAVVLRDWLVERGLARRA